MLKKKMIRDVLQNKSQFITIFLMVLIGVMVYVGIESYMDGMINAADKFYSENNLQDLNVMGNNLTKEDLEKIKTLNNVTDAERKLVVTGIDADDNDKTYLISFIESNNISKFYVITGEEFDANKKGVWVDNFYAEKNNLNVGDTIKIQYDSFILEEKILGLINVPDHIYDVKDESELVPNRNVFGFVYLSYNEIPENYIKSMVMENLQINDDKLIDQYIKDFNYKNYIPYNYIMVDVDSKDNVNNVKNDIEDNVKDALAIIKIEDTSSYLMYQGEIDEGASYVGIFSGLFLFIALLSVITTMTRVVKKQKLQIGTLKALGFKNYKISLHYISYGFLVSLIASIFGIFLGRFFIGNVFLGLEMSFFEVPNGVPVINKGSYVVALAVVLVVSFITYLTCRKELKKVKIKNPKTVKKAIKKLKKNKKYYVKVRAYTDYNGVRYYGDRSTMLSSYYSNVYATYYSYYVNNKNRTTNLKIASKKINGTIIQPGETFDFNKVVGSRTAAKGYKKAHVFTGENSTTMGLAGGICQVASTVFNTALISNVKIVERHQHSQRVSYVPLGRDAAISGNVQNFRWKNNTKYAIKIKMTVKGGKITCTFYTCQKAKPKKVKLKVTQKGKTFTLKRSVKGKTNYSCKSKY